MFSSVRRSSSTMEATPIFSRARDKTLRVDGGHSQGPYIVVAGTPEVIHYTAGGSSATAYWKKANRFIGDKARSDTAVGLCRFLGTSRADRCAQQSRKHAPVKRNLPLSQLVKALVPQGWTGSAQKDIDLTTSATFSTRDGENWMQSLDRLIAALRPVCRRRLQRTSREPCVAPHLSRWQ